ncbi:podocalyxin [Pempheris klunzingeri]|uniref:podocalyxin n=1 Tax=Pempheris klunzingeri TaxID=3127111 RepID=UPI00398035A2
MPTAGGKSGAETAANSTTTVPAGNITGATPTVAVTKLTTIKPTPAAHTSGPMTTMVAILKPADKITPTQPQASNVTNNSPAPPNGSPAAPAAVTISTTPAAAVPTTATNSSSVSVVAPTTITLKMPDASVSCKTSGTKTPDSPPVGSEGTTNITKVSTPTAGQQSMTHTTINSNTSQEVSKGGTEVTNVTTPSPKHAAPKAPESAGNTGTTSPPFTLTKAGTPAPGTSGNKAGNTPPQDTVTTNASASTISTTSSIITTTTTTTVTAAQPKTFLYSLNSSQEKEEEKKELGEVCRRLMVALKDGNCTLTWRHHNGKLQFDLVEINGKVKTSLANQYYEEITKKPTDNKTLIAILASCGALLIMIVILAVCASHHRKPYNENQQHLTEELHTVENGYHDNPTLEVMEVQPEMQEKKMALNGEFNDSWIVPIDNLLKEDIPDEEDTHL